MRKAERLRREAYEGAVEYLCAQFALLEEEFGGPDWAGRVGAITSGEPFTEEWYAAVLRLHESLEAGGLPGGLGLTTPMGGTEWPGPSPRTAGWVCPTGACSRVRRTEGGAPEQDAPRCALVGRAMRFVGD
ncbi:hypothetical protein [Streptomyces sp. NPDC059783]|uniref:hypothetical protein n=1 Tax=Streptomyces sp. NPDC059783 TaxID=3346944 RepID=UPI00365242CD